jgi:purine-binding chemotaxis protein CheW
MSLNLDFLANEVKEIDADTETVVHELEEREGELCLSFYVPSGRKFALPAFGVREVISTLADRITPIPNVSPCLLGTFNWRGQVIWIADLGQFLGDALLVNVDRGEVSLLVVEEQETVMGFAISSVADTEWLKVHQMAPSQDIPEGTASFIKGAYSLGEGKFLHLLDQVAILSSVRWAS